MSSIVVRCHKGHPKSLQGSCVVLGKATCIMHLVCTGQVTKEHSRWTDRVSLTAGVGT